MCNGDKYMRWSAAIAVLACASHAAAAGITAARLPASTREALRDPLLRAARELGQALGGPI